MTAETIHATAVTAHGRGCLLTGPAGAGKSTMAMEMIALGAILIADDRVIVAREEDAITLRAPEQLRGLIEARGVGLLHAGLQDSAPLALVVDLSQDEPDRLPPPRQTPLLGRAVPVIYGRGRAGLAAIVMLWLRAGGRADP